MINHFLDKVAALFDAVYFYDKWLNPEIAWAVGDMHNDFEGLVRRKDTCFTLDAGPMLQDMEKQLHSFLKQARKDAGDECKIISIHSKRAERMNP